MEAIPFKAKIRRNAGTYIVTIPSDYINNGLLPEGVELQFTAQIPPQPDE